MPELNQSEIARISQVSQATVSRVLNGDPRVNTELRDRVLVALKAHDYVPDSRAQSLRSQKTGVLGLVVQRSPQALAAEPFYHNLIAQILEIGGQRNYHLCVDAARTARSRHSIFEEMLRTRRVDGLILVEPKAEDEGIARLMREGFPFVLIGRYPMDETVYSVDNDNVDAARIAAEHLYARGRRRIAYIGGIKEVMCTLDRLEGYRRTLEAHGDAFDPALTRFGHFDEKTGYDSMTALLDLPHPPDAVVAVDDVVAAGAMRAAHARGVCIPQQLAIVGFNDSFFCSYLHPALTSVSIDTTDLAQTAAGMLIDLIEQRPVTPRRRIVPCRLVDRASS